LRAIDFRNPLQNQGEDRRPSPEQVAVAAHPVAAIIDYIVRRRHGGGRILLCFYERQRGLSQRYSSPLSKLYVLFIGKFRSALRSIATTVADFIEYAPGNRFNHHEQETPDVRLLSAPD
jgi:hypothetical protein